MRSSRHDISTPPSLPPEAVERLRAQLLRFLSRRTHDTDLAEDLTQEALLHVLRGLPRYRGLASLSTWARRIALNVWRDHLRRTAARPAEQAGLSVLSLLDMPDGGAVYPRAEVEHDRHATHDCLIAKAHELPLAARRIVLLHDFEEMNLGAVAAALGCSPATAKVRLHRARRRLAQLCRADCQCESGFDGEPLCTPTGAGCAVKTTAAQLSKKGRT